MAVRQHGNTQRQQISFGVRVRTRGVEIKPDAGEPVLSLWATTGSFVLRPDWYLDRYYAPNVFPDAGTAPLFNTVDASLWFFQAAYKFLLYTGDDSFIREHIWPVLQDIITWYAEGSRYGDEPVVPRGCIAQAWEKGDRQLFCGRKSYLISRN